MKNRYIKNIRSYARAWILVFVSVAMAAGAQAQTITIDNTTEINDAINDGIYTYDDIDVEYTAADYPSGTTFYLVLDTNNNGLLDAEEDDEDLILDQSNSLSGTLSGSLSAMIGNYNFYIIAAESGTLGVEEDSYDLDDSQFTQSGSVDDDLVFDAHLTERSLVTPSYDLTSDNYLLMRINLTATDVVEANPIIVEYSSDGDPFETLEDQFGESEFFDGDGELLFALSQSINVDDVEFRVSQTNGETLDSDAETWTVGTINIQEYTGTLVQFDEQYVATINIQSPSFTINDDNFGDFIGEELEIDYRANGFTTGATFYLFSGDITDPEDRIIYDSSESSSAILTGNWPLDIGDDNITVKIAGVYGNIDEAVNDFDGELTLQGSSSTTFWYYFNQAGVRSATTEALNLVGEDFVTLSVDLDIIGALSNDDAVIIQYSTDGSTWMDLEDNDGNEEYTQNLQSMYHITLGEAVKTASTQFRVRQKSIDLEANSGRWYLDALSIVKYEIGNQTSISSPYVNNYSVSVSNLEDTDDASIIGGSIYPGDEIKVTASVAGFDVETENYTVLINNSFLLDNEVVTIDEVTDEISIVGNIPLNVEYDDDADIHVKIYEGDNPLIQVNENVFADYESDEIKVVGTELAEDDTYAQFDMAGERSLTTPSFNIASTASLTLEFTLTRVNSVRSPSGTDIILEYSTDGTDYTEIESININDAAGGESYSFDSEMLPSAMASPMTSLRFRQASNNGLDLDRWKVEGITLMGGTNISDPGYINYSAQEIDVLSPAISLTAIDNVNQDWYPGSELSVEFEIFGSFPAGTAYELIMEREFGGSISFGDFSSEGTYNVTVPSVGADTYELYILSSHEGKESNKRDLVVSEVSISNIVITSSDAVTDGDDDIIYPGNSISIAYDVVGNMSDDAVMNLEIMDHATNEFMFIAENEELTGSLSASLPVGIDYNGNDADFRFTITNGNLSSYEVVIDETWNTDSDRSDVYFPLDSRMEHNASNYFYASNLNSGVRSAQSIGLDFSEGGRIDLDLYTVYYEQDQNISLQYSIDDGDEWVEISSSTISGSYSDLFDYVDIPEEAWVDDLLIRFITEEINLNVYYGNYLYFYGFSVEAYNEIPIAEQEFSLNDDLTLEHLSVSMSTLEDASFILGETINVEYNVEGPFDEDVDFAVVLEQDGEYVILAESDQTGAVQIEVSVPVFPFADTDMSYNLDVVPFVKLGVDDVYRAAAEEEEISEEDDILAMEGRATSSTGSNGYSDFRFNQKGDRSLSTRSFDLENYGRATLDFDFTWYDGDYTTILTLVELEVSTDGGANYHILPIPDATYEAEGLVYPSGSYSIDIPEEYLTSTTQFRWNQPLSLGEDKDNWRVNAISVNKGESNALNAATYISYNMQSISIVLPSLDNYKWEQADISDAVFSGESFDYSWDINEDLIDGSNFPGSTEYVFTINQEDPETGENIIIGSTDAMGVFEASVPSYLENNIYDVMLTASVSVDDEIHFIFEDEKVASLAVFLNTIVTEYAGDDNAVIYAGNNVTFSIIKENDESSSGSLNELYANLIMTYNGNDWLMASQIGAGDISMDLPPYVRGSTSFRVEFTEGSPFGNIGEIIDESTIGQLEDDEANFINGHVVGDVSFDNLTGRGLITTRVFEAGELASAELFEFDLSFDKLSSEITSEQSIIFEYSLDGGESFTEVETYPEMDADEVLTGEQFSYEVSDEMKSTATILRWRQEEINGSFSIENVGFTFAKILPFDYLGTSISVNEQALLITAFDSNETCLESDIMLSYEIRGKFGSNNVVNIYYDQEGGGDDMVENYEFNLIDGSGELTFSLHDVLSTNDHNSDFKFYLYADDDTDPDNDFTVQGPDSETAIEVIAPIALDASFSVPQQYLCSTKDIEVSISNLQNYFTYELLNEADGSSLGSLTYDPDVDMSTINIGTLVDPIEMELSVTSSSSSGDLSCNTVISTETELLVINPIYELYRSKNGGGSYLLSFEDNETICESNHELFLRVGRVASNGSGVSYLNSLSDLEWFRDDLNTSLGNSITWSTFSKSGDYFARVSDGDCSYLTETIAVTVEELPDRPEVTVVSGELSFCEGQGSVVLEAPEGFNYYDWNTGETSRQITVENAGSYFVNVSNLPTSLGCESTNSVPVVLESSEMIELKVQSANSTSDEYAIQEGEGLQACDSKRVYFFDNNSSSFGGTIAVMLDGMVYGSTTSNFFDLAESGEYSVVWSSDDLSASCIVTSPTFSVEITESPEEAPMLTSTDALIFCEGISATLEAETGFSYYRWYRNNNALYLNSSSIVVDESGRYQVQVSNVPFENNCSSPLSKALEVSVTSNPNLYLSGNYDEGETLNICSDEDFYLQANNSGSNGVTWYHDGVVIAGSSVTSTPRLNIAASGAYYAEIVKGGLTPASQCTFQTVSVNVVYSEAPSMEPELTSSDDLTFCEGVSATLEAETGFSYYRWYRDNNALYLNSSSIVVDESGRYQVQVSNVPFENGCSSPLSLALEVVATSNPDLYLSGNYDEGEILNICSDEDFYLQANNSGSNGVTWYHDGVVIAGSSVTSTPRLNIAASGAYYAEIVKGGLTPASQCTFQTVTVNVVYSEAPSVVPVITTTDDLIFCDNNSISLSATAGSNYYRWYKGGNIINSNSATIVVSTSGNYTVEVSDIPFSHGCYSQQSDPVTVQAYVDPEIYMTHSSATNIALSEGEELVFCEGDGTSILARNIGSSPVTWYLDGVAISGSSANTGTTISYFEPTVSGAYYAEVTLGGVTAATQCSYQTNTVNVVVSAMPASQTITSSGALEFCEGEGEVVLSTASGFTTYHWMRDGVSINDGDGFDQTNNTYTVYSTGEYSVMVGNNGCLGEESNVINVEVRDLPATASFAQSGTSCGAGAIEFTINDSNADPGLVYQLMNRSTGLPSGSAVASDGNELTLTSGSIAEAAEFYLEISYADGSACMTEGTTYVMGSPNNVMLELSGNTLLSTVSSYHALSGNFEMKWFRNGVHLFQHSDESLTVVDGAEYLVEVVFDNGCTVTSNSIDLAPVVVADSTGRTNVSSARTYPNPSTNDQMNIGIEGDDMGAYQVSIMSMTGLVMRTYTLEKDEIDFSEVISLSGLKQGIYNLRVTKGDDYKNIRILKN